MCVFDIVQKKYRKGWKEDPSLSLNDNLYWGSLHFTCVFFNKYKISRHQNEFDYDDLASDCALAVYDYAKSNLDKWDRTKWRLDQYLYGKAWSYVGSWLDRQFKKKQRELRDIKLNQKERNINEVEMDVGVDEIGANNFDACTRYTVWSPNQLYGTEKALSDEAMDYLSYVDECVDFGLEPEEPEDWCMANKIKDGDIERIKKILRKSPSKTAKKKCRRPSLERL